MKNLDDGATTGFAASVLLLIPVLVICALPVALGIGCDIIGAAGEAPVVLAIGAPAAAVLCSFLLGAATPRLRAARRSATFTSAPNPKFAMSRATEVATMIMRTSSPPY